MAYASTKLTRVRYCATAIGTFVVIAFVQSGAPDFGTDGGDTEKYFGGKIVDAGDKTVEMTVEMLFDRSDTNGQEAIVGLWDTGAMGYFQWCPEGTTTGKKVDQFGAVVTRVSHASAASEKYVKRTVTLQGDADTLQRGLLLA